MNILETAPTAERMNEGKFALMRNSYPGRLLIIGKSAVESTAQVAYALTGRSDGSRKRVFVDEGYGNVRTSAPGKVEQQMSDTPNSELIYYQATRSNDGLHVVSNGAQTEPVFDKVSSGASFVEAVKSAPTIGGQNLSSYEPDKPNYTPRITGVIDLRKDASVAFGLAIAKKAQDSDDTNYSFFGLALGATLPETGVGYGIHTYAHDADPLPSYDAAPFAFPMGVDCATTARSIWNLLSTNRRVAVVVHGIDLREKRVTTTSIINSPLV